MDAEEMGIECIAFDIDGTLYPKRAMLIRLAVSSLLHLPFSLRYNRMRQRIRKEDGCGRARSSSAEEFLQREKLLLYPHAKSTEWLKEKEEKALFGPWEHLFSSIKPYPGMKEALLEAKRKGYRLAVLSDFPIGSKLSALGVEELFEYKATSSDSGGLKPSINPFEALIDAMDLPAERILYVGDSESKDIKGAHNAGMRTALISPSRRKVYSIADILFSSWDEFREKVL